MLKLIIMFMCCDSFQSNSLSERKMEASTGNLLFFNVKLEPCTCNVEAKALSRPHHPASFKHSFFMAFQSPESVLSSEKSQLILLSA